MRLSTSHVLLLVGALSLAGCPKGSKKIQVDEEAAAVDPGVNFDAGLQAMQPDRKGNVDFAQAYDFFAKAEQLNGGKKASFNAGYTAEKIGELSKAAGHYRKAFDADATYEPALYSLTRVLKAQGQTAEIPALFEAYLAARPDDMRVRTEYMDALAVAGRDEEAIAVGRKILETNPDNDAVYRALSSMYLKQGRVPLARLMGDKALELNDADPDIYNNLGVVLLESGDEPGAIDKFQMARKLDSKHFEANMNLGAIALDSGDYGLAMDCFTAANERNPASKPARLGLAVALRGTGDFDGAGRIYDTLIKEDPSYDKAWFNAATLHERYTKDFTKALDYLSRYKDTKAGELSPNDEVFARIQRVEAAKTAEEERKRLEEERRKAEEERQRRAKELLAKMEAQLVDLQTKLDANAACLDEMVAMEIGMAIETAGQVVEAQDTGMASDVQQMLDSYYVPMLEEAIAACAGTPPADDTAEGGDTPEGEATEGDAAEADATEGADEAPADEPPADEPAPEAAEGSEG